MVFKKKQHKQEIDDMIEEVDSVNKKLENMQLSRNLDDKIKGNIKRITKAPL